MYFRISLLAALLAACSLSLTVTPVEAGTTGGLHGRVTDSTTGAPIAGAKVSATSPSQNETVLTDAGGVFIFISLSPDTYTLTASKDGYDIGSLPGITVVSDQSRNVTVSLQKTLKTLATISTRATASLVRPGTTSDVYSINAATQKATSSLAGSGSLNQAYGAVASAPGVVYQQGQQGWYQSIYIRGGDIDQTAYELDGIPTMRVSDSATVTTLTNLGQQEMQVYTGGTPASADASGIAGYVNQVIKTGTYPGFEDLTLGIGGPALYNGVQFEAGGASPDRRFSYYIGQSNSAEGYRYGDQFNGASDPLFFMPAYIPSHNGNSFNGACSLAPCVFDGSGTPLFSPGTSDAQASTADTESVANFHYQLPHKNDPLHDDVQLLYVYSNILQRFYTSLSDLGLSSLASQNLVSGVFNCGGGTPCAGPIAYFDQLVYNGPLMQPPNPNDIAVAPFPNSGDLRPVGQFQNIPLTEREGSQNGAGIEKLQFQKNIDAKTYLRIFGYAEDSWWFISGPVSANLTYGDQLPDYEVDGHTYGGDAIFSRQLSDKHLLNATVSYFTSKLETYSMGFQSGNIASFFDAAGNCYGKYGGQLDSCYASSSQGFESAVASGPLPTPGPSTPAALAGARWLITENGQNAQIDTVRPYFTAASITDTWRPTDRITANIGIRIENFRYRLQDLASAYPARQFWFNAYNNEFCWGVGAISSVSRFNTTTNTFDPCPTGTSPVDLQNFHGGTLSQTVPQPRLGLTYEMNPDNVIRASYGRYARPAPTSYQEYNTYQQDLPSFLGTFVNTGWNTPVHYMYADTSDNLDLSLEHHFPGTDMAMKVTPFVRTTQGQIQYSSLNAQGVVAGVNAGKQVSDGVELAINRGSFDRDGFSFALSATYTRSKIHYGPYPNGLNVIDLLNAYIQQYNSYTSACATASVSNNPSSVCGINGNQFAIPLFTNNVSSGVANPYYNAKPQPLLDRNGWYSTYDQIPSVFSNAIGFETPFQASLVLNWKRGPVTVTPNFIFSTQGKYGSPLQWPGYDPASCTGVTSGTTADTTTCSNYIIIPEKYTGVFDSIGAFQQPNRLTANLSVGYQFSSHLTATLTAANLIDHCYQRNLPWSNGPTCEYAQLQSNLLPPAGNFVANPPIQLAYPYGSWYNNLEIAQMGQRNPVEATLEFEFRP